MKVFNKNLCTTGHLMLTNRSSYPSTIEDAQKRVYLLYENVCNRPCAMSVCMNVQIEALTKARDSKFGFADQVYFK